MRQPGAFDLYAPDYDLHFTHSSIGKMQRQQVWKHLLPLLESKMDILEINCGTGEDAIQLGLCGHRIVATDASQSMIQVATKKLKELNEPLDIEFLACNFKQLNTALIPQQFDLVFSNFGGLNCIDPSESELLSDTLSEFLQPKGLLFLVYMAPKCMWERFYFLYKADARNAFRRKLHEAVQVKLDQQTIPVWYYTWKQVFDFFQKNFKLKKVRPVGLWVPPSYMEHYFNSRPHQLKSLAFLDRYSNFRMFANFADHFVLILQKK